MKKVTAKTEPTAEINENVVVLETPLKRGDTLITEIEVFRPNAGSLRGVRLSDVAHSDVDALIVVLPRITSPTLTAAECGRLELPDLVALAGKVIGFLSPKQGGVTLDPKLEVDDLMADIAAIFHWPPSELWGLSLTELVRWRHKALLRSGAVNHE